MHLLLGLFGYTRGTDGVVGDRFSPVFFLLFLR